MADAYLVEVTTPAGEQRRELYHTQAAAEQTVAMYARGGSWKARIVPLNRLPDAGDSAPGERGDAGG